VRPRESRCEQIINDIRQAIKDNADVSRAEEPDKRPPAGRPRPEHRRLPTGRASRPGPGAQAAAGGKGEDVIDAEFEEKK